MADIVMENLIATSHLHQTFDLEELAKQIPESSIDQQEQKVLVFHFNYGKIAVLLSEDGKIVCTGTTTIDDARENINSVINQLQQIDDSIDPSDTTLSFSVATTDLNQTLSLETIAETLPDEKISYEPQTNPWLQYQFDEQLSILIFSSGKIVFTGNKNKEQLSTIVETLKATLTSAGVL